MANKRTNAKVTKEGKEYNYYRLTRYVMDYDENLGKFVRKRKSFYGKSVTDAERKLEAYKKQMEALQIEKSKSTSERLSERTFGDAIESYIDNTFMPNSTIKDATKLRYINSYHNIFDGKNILKRPLKEVCGEDLQAVFTQSSYAPSSKAAALKLLRNYFKYASSQHIAHDITQGIVIPKAKTRRQDQSIVVYTGEEYDALLKFTPHDHRQRFLVVLAMETGCRIGELLALTYSDFDLTAKKIRINKSASEVAPIKANNNERERVVEITTTKSIESVRSMRITPLIEDEFIKHRKWHKEESIRIGYRNDYVFTTKTGELYFPSNMRTALKRLCTRIGIECKGWHAFRHTYGSNLAEFGIPIESVSKRMGHSDISVTSKYYINISTEQMAEEDEKIEEGKRKKRAAASNQ